MHELSPQRSILVRWLDSLHAIPAVQVAWLEGSLVDSQRANLGSDIDVRLALSDEAYESLWQNDKSLILAGLGPILRLIDANWIRALTLEGYIVELAVYRVSDLAGLAPSEWEFLINRLPDGQPNFQKLPLLSPAETWPDREPLTAEWVWRQTEITLVNLANAPGPFYNGEWHSVLFTLNDLRTELVKLLYRTVGIYYAKRYKHLSTVLTPTMLADLAYTYPTAGESLQPTILAATFLRVGEMTGKYLQLLGERAGGGFPAEWYWPLLAQTKVKLQPWLPDGV